jgi:flotillin
MPTLIILAIVALFVFIMITSVLRRYKRCPSDRILVVYGKVGGGGSAKCIHGGAAFIWPVFQDYSFMDLTPISIEVNLTNSLSKQNIRVDVPSKFTVGISTESGCDGKCCRAFIGSSTSGCSCFGT